MSKKPPCTKYEPPIHTIYTLENNEYCRVSASDNDLEKANCPKEYIKMDMSELETILKFQGLPVYDTKYERCMTLKQNDLKKLIKSSFDCNNKEELYTMSDVREIEDQFFYPYYDPNDQKVYCFDHRVLAKMINDKNLKNPYNQYDIPEWIIADVKKNYIKKEKQPLLLGKINIKDKVNLKINDMFGEFDLLGYYTTALMKSFRNYDIYDLRLLYCLFYTDIVYNSQDLGQDIVDNLQLKNKIKTSKQLTHIYGLDKNGMYLLLCDKVLHIIKKNLHDNRGYLVEYVNKLLKYMIAINDKTSKHNKLINLYTDNYQCLSKIINNKKKIYFNGKLFSKSLKQFKHLSMNNKKKALVSLYVNIEKYIIPEKLSKIHIIYRSIRIIFMN